MWLVLMSKRKFLVFDSFSLGILSSLPSFLPHLSQFEIHIIPTPDSDPDNDSDAERIKTLFAQRFYGPADRFGSVPHHCLNHINLTVSHLEHMKIGQASRKKNIRNDNALFELAKLFALLLKT